MFDRGNGHRGNQRGKACFDLSLSPLSFITDEPCIIIYLLFFTAKTEKKYRYILIKCEITMQKYGPQLVFQLW